MIYFQPWGERTHASSRLRVHLVQPFIENSQVGVPKRFQDGDILIIQKRPDRELMKRAKAEGAKVIYDIDDYYWERSDFRNMLHDADLITVDTESKKEALVGPIAVIPDALDWDGERRTEDLRNGIACWTSYGNNARHLEGLTFPYALKLITTPDYSKQFTGACQYVPWNLATVDEEIRKSELMVIPLTEYNVTKYKGMHKMLKAWANGVPCYATRIPDYERAIKEAGVSEEYLVEDWSNFKNIGFDEKCYEYAIQFKAENIAKLWKQAIGRVASGA